MSGEVRSPVEEALENQPFGALQLRVVLLCALVQAFDGFDLGTIGMAAPSLSKAWGVPPAQFTIAFVMSSVGILIGALASGPLGDRFGRKPLLVISVAFIGLYATLSAFAWSIPSMTAMRFLTGLGIGGDFQQRSSAGFEQETEKDLLVLPDQRPVVGGEHVDHSTAAMLICEGRARWTVAHEDHEGLLSKAKSWLATLRRPTPSKACVGPWSRANKSRNRCSRSCGVNVGHSGNPRPCAITSSWMCACCVTSNVAR